MEKLRSHRPPAALKLDKTAIHTTAPTATAELLHPSSTEHTRLARRPARYHATMQEMSVRQKANPPAHTPRGQSGGIMKGGSIDLGRLGNVLQSTLG